MIDVAGRVRSLWTHYYDHQDAIIFVVDSTDQKRFCIVKEEIKKLESDLGHQNVNILIE